jgi:hypothetical protein
VGDAYYRSHQNWGEVYARWLRSEYDIKTTVVNLARDGDITEGVLGRNDDRGWPVAQLDSNRAAIEGADLIMLTIGGNDVEFANIVKQCFVVGLRNGAGCEGKINTAKKGLERVMRRTETIFERLESMVDTNRTEVVLVGYPFLSIDTEDYNLCKKIQAGELGSARCVSTYDAAGGVRSAGELANKAQAELVAGWNRSHRLKVTYVSGVSSLFAGHEPDPSASSRNDYRWLNEFLETEGVQVGDQPTKAEGSLDANEFYHPNVTGHEKIAQAVEGLVGVPEQANGGIWGRDPIDVTFVVDTTARYGDSEEEAARRLGETIGQVRSWAQGVDDRSRSARFALVSFGDQNHDTWWRMVSDFTYSADELSQAALGVALSRNAGSNLFWLSWLREALMESLGLEWRDYVRKTVIVVSPRLADHPRYWSAPEVDEVRSLALRVDPVEVYGVDLTGLGADEGFIELVEATNGLVVDASQVGATAAVDQIVARVLDNPLAWIQGPYVARTGGVVRLDAGGSYSPYGQIVSYEWDFEGDGNWDETTTDWWVDHRFTEPFDGVVGLRVTDTEGSRAVGSTPVVVSDDGDSMPAEVDNCPDVYNWGQQDSDGDGLGDECDPTPGLDAYEGDDDGMVFTKAEVEELLAAQATLPGDTGGTDTTGTGGTDGGASPTSGGGVGGSGSAAGGSKATGSLPVTGVVSPTWVRVAAPGLVLAGVLLILAARVRPPTRGRHNHD